MRGQTEWERNIFGFLPFCTACCVPEALFPLAAFQAFSTRVQNREATTSHLPRPQIWHWGLLEWGQAKDRVADRKRNLTVEPFRVLSEPLSVVPEQWLLPLGWILWGSMQSRSRVVKGRIRCVVGWSAARCWACSQALGCELYIITLLTGEIFHWNHKKHIFENCTF